MSKGTKKISKNAEVSYVGEIPKQGSIIENITRPLNVFNYFYSKQDAKEWWLEFLKKRNHPKYNTCKSLPDSKMTTTLGWISKLLLLECTLPQQSLDYFDREETRLIRLSEELNTEKKEISSNKDTKFKNEHVQLIADIEDEIDKFIGNYCKGDFSAASLFIQSSATQTHIRMVKDTVSPFLEELNLINKDKEIKESYAYLSKTEQSRLIKFLENIIDDVDKTLDNAKKQRTPRAKKAPSTDKILKSFKYLQRSNELNMVSVAPSKILGCNTLWVYNNKTRTLFYLIAKEGMSLSIQGTTIINFDETKSFSKKVRKPEIDIPKISQGARKSVFKVFNELTTKETPHIVGRINQDCLILRTDK